MRAIWKYSLTVADEFKVTLPEGAIPLTVQMQGGSPQLWALVDRAAETQQVTVRWYGTGQPCEPVGQYIGTIQMHGGGIVFHCWIELE